MEKVLFIDTQVIKDTTNIDDNISDKILRYSITKTQDYILKNLIGSVLYEKLEKGIINSTLSTDDKYLITTYIWPVLINGSQSYLIQDNTYRTTNAGTGKVVDDNFEILSRTELDAHITRIQNDLDFSKDLLFNYLCNNSDLFPEFSEYNDNGKSATNSLSTRNIHFSTRNLTGRNNNSFF